MIVLALDQASRISGYSVFKDKELIASGKIVTSNDHLGQRLFSLREKVKSLCEKYNVDIIVLEGIQLQSNVANNAETHKILGEVLGVLEELATELVGTNYEIVPSVTWKSGLGIKGKQRPEQKRNAQKYVAENYGKKVTQDESDAICIGAYYVNKDIGLNWED